MSTKSTFTFILLFLAHLVSNGQNEITDYDSLQIDSFRYTPLVNDLNLNDSTKRVFAQRLKYGEVLKDSAVLKRDMKMLMDFAFFIDSFIKETHTSPRVFTTENTVKRGLTWVKLSGVYEDYKTLRDATDDLGIGHLVTEEEIEFAKRGEYPSLANNGARGIGSISIDYGEVSEKTEYKLTITNETSEVLYLYIDGVYFKKVYEGKVETISTASGCTFFEAENRLGSIGKRSICFSNKKNYSWKIKKAIN